MSTATNTITPAKKKSSRILALDIMRGITIAGMILVNNSGARAPMRRSSTPSGTA